MDGRRSVVTCFGYRDGPSLFGDVLRGNKSSEITNRNHAMKFFSFLIVCGVTVMCLVPAAPENARGMERDIAIVSEEFVAEVFRPFIHSATIVETKPGELAAAWYGGSYEAHGY